MNAQRRLVFYELTATLTVADERRRSTAHLKIDIGLGFNVKHSCKKSTRPDNTNIDKHQFNMKGSKKRDRKRRHLRLMNHFT